MSMMLVQLFVWVLIHSTTLTAASLITSWTTLTTKFDTAEYRMQGAYSIDTDCVYIAILSNQYCFNVSSESLAPLTLTRDLSTYNGVYQNTVLFEATNSNTFQSDILYYIHGNDRRIIKHDIDNRTMFTLTGSNFMSSIINTNPCLVSHSSNQDYLFVVGNNVTNINQVLLIVYNIMYNNYTIVNVLNHYHSRFMCSVVDDYLYVLGGDSIYIERISLDDIIEEFSNDNLGGVDHEWESVNATLPNEYNQVWSASVVNYDRIIYIMGGRTDHETPILSIVYFNVDTLDVGYNNVSLPFRMADSLAVYVLIFTICIYIYISLLIYLQ